MKKILFLIIIGLGFQNELFPQRGVIICVKEDGTKKDPLLNTLTAKTQKDPSFAKASLRITNKQKNYRMLIATFKSTEPSKAFTCPEPKNKNYATSFCNSKGFDAGIIVCP